MALSTKVGVFQLERHLIDARQWSERVPEEVRLEAERGMDGGPIGIARFWGVWYVLCAGQGPFVAAELRNGVWTRG